MTEVTGLRTVEMMKRDNILRLDGEWILNGKPVNVPFPPGTVLSGYEEEVPEKLEYVTRFRMSLPGSGMRVLLHFTAVDQTCRVYLNGAYIGGHEGGYLPFEFDITEHLNEESNELMVNCEDSLSHLYPYGKQSEKPHGMWYTPVSGIWGSVWLEAVPEKHLRSLILTPDADSGRIDWEYSARGTGTIEISVYAGGKRVAFCGSTETAGTLSVPESELKLWSPEEPFLYRVRAVFDGKDTVRSYCAFRKIDIRNIGGANRVCLNGRPVFLQGVLDQGYYPGGRYLPDDPSRYEDDIMLLKRMGFNTIRKHIKVEPEAFYSACDRLGMLVIQDMVNSGEYSFFRDSLLPTLGFTKRKNFPKEPEREKFFIRHMEDTAFHLYPHPSVIAYTIFNEGWGEFDPDGAYDRLRSIDPTRLIDTASGWFSGEKSDFDSVHVYFRTKELIPSERPMLLSECGGFTMVPPGSGRKAGWGYGKADSTEKLTGMIERMYEKMVIPAVKKGLCGCIYTQLCDVEGEMNGLVSEDRTLVKADTERMNALSERVYKELYDACGTEI